MMVMLLMLTCSTPLQAEPQPNDSEALAGLKSAKVIFDVRVADLEKLVFNLRLFNETMEGIAAQGVKPEMVVTFRSSTVKILNAAALDDEARNLFRDLKKKGVQFEACAVAMRILKVDQAGLIPEVKLVANVFNSLIGYQNKGYAMIAIN
jgi:intracellular sulfur oxidation DsrE/DsrF family protein